MKQSTITLCIFFILNSLVSDVFAGELQIQSKVSNIYKNYGIQVYYNYNSSSFFPKKWQKPPISAQGQKLSLSKVERILPIIEKFLSAYPKQTIKRNLQKIYLLSELNFYGKSFGATNSREAIYITSGEFKLGYSDIYLLGRMHSEFSSILMRNYNFPEKAWNKLNPTNFKYGGSGVEMLGQKKLYGQTPELLSKGFVVRYAQSSIENDFNMISDWMFTRRQRLLKLGVKYPRIKSKIGLALEFYNSVDKKSRAK